MQHQDQMVTVNNLVAKVGIHIIRGEVQAHQVHIYPVIQRLGCLLESVQSLLYYEQAMLQLLPLCGSILLPLHLDSTLSVFEYLAFTASGYSTLGSISPHHMTQDHGRLFVSPPIKWVY